MTPLALGAWHRGQAVPELLSAQAALTTHYSPRGLTTRHSLPTVLDAEKSKFKEPEDAVPSKDALPVTAIQMLCLHRVERNSSTAPLLSPDTNSIMGPTRMASCDPNQLPMSHLLPSSH